jgi:hypothetical protein
MVDQVRARKKMAAPLTASAPKLPPAHQFLVHTPMWNAPFIFFEQENAKKIRKIKSFEMPMCYICDLVLTKINKHEFWLFFLQIGAIFQ